MSPAQQHAYRYRLTATLVVDDHSRLGPEVLADLARGILRVLPGARTTGVAVDIEELERLPEQGSGSQ